MTLNLWYLELKLFNDIFCNIQLTKAEIFFQSLHIKYQVKNSCFNIVDTLYINDV